MERFHNNIMHQVEFTQEELFQLMYWSGQTKFDSKLHKDMHKKLTVEYMDALTRTEKARKAHVEEQSRPDHLAHSSVKMQCQVDLDALENAWALYTNRIRENKEIAHFEPITFVEFADLLDYFFALQVKNMQLQGRELGFSRITIMPESSVIHCIEKLQEMHAQELQRNDKEGEQYKAEVHENLKTLEQVIEILQNMKQRADQL